MSEKPTPAHHRYLFHDPHGRDFKIVSDRQYWNGQRPIESIPLYSAEQLDAYADARCAELRDVLLRRGFVPCDLPACNCGSWHWRYGLPERMQELKDLLSEAGHPLSNENGNLPSGALRALVSERDELRAEVEWLRKDAVRYRWLRGREDGRYMVVYAFRTDIDEVCLGHELDAAIDAAMENAHD